MSQLLAWPLILLVRAYQVVVSPWLGSNCRYQPSCSRYAIEALQQHGVWHGSRLATKRILRCHPWGDSGYDPVPKQETDRRDTD